MKTEHSDISSNNKRIAKNTVMLYIRMLINMAVGLYTSRVVLHILGVEDFGVCNVVGGVVGMLSFLKASMGGATSRFLTFELGRGDHEKLSITFNSALVVHIGIALFVFVIAETAGLWFLYHKIVIPDGRMTAAAWIYQFSVLSTMVAITQVPYNASIIAHEKMDVYAYVEIAHTLLKLLTVYLLCIISLDKLIVYGALSFVVSISIAFYYRIYCIRYFNECHFQLKIEKNIIKEMLSFSGYNLLGNFGFVAKRQGTNIIINNFFGVVFNAASGIAFAVSNTVTSFANYITTVFRPPIIKAYAQNNADEMERYVMMALNLSVFVVALVAIPSMIEMNTLINLWLVEVPSGAILFSQLIIVSLLFQFSRHIMTICIHATGRVKSFSMINGILMTISPILLYFCYCIFPYVAIAFIINICLEFTLLVISIFYSSKYIPYISKRRVFITLLRLYIVLFITYVFTSAFSMIMSPCIVRIILTTIFSSFVLSIQTLFFCLNISQRCAVITYIRSHIPWCNQ